MPWAVGGSSIRVDGGWQYAPSSEGPDPCRIRGCTALLAAGVEPDTGLLHLMAPRYVGRGGGYFDRAMRCCSFFAWRRIERFSCRPFSSMCFAVLSARLSADLIVSALIRACITFFPNAFPIAFSLVESRSAPGWLTLWFPASCEAVAGISPLPGSCRTAGRCFADELSVPLPCLMPPPQWPAELGQFAVLGIACLTPGHASELRPLPDSQSRLPAL